VFAIFFGTGIRSLSTEHERHPAALSQANQADEKLTQEGAVEAVVLRCLSETPVDHFADVTSLGMALTRCRLVRQWSAADAERWWHSPMGEPNQWKTERRLGIVDVVQIRAPRFPYPRLLNKPFTCRVISSGGL
jgi:hypothetical protein